MIYAITAFVVMYVLLLALPKYRHWTALITALLFLASPIYTWSEAVHSIDYNVLLMIAGTMGLVSMFIDTGMPSLMADVILDRMKNVKWAMIAMAVFAGVISAFVDNVATVLMVAPVALAIAKKYEISPVNMIIAISVSSNLQGAATLVGDTTSIMLGGYAGMDFLDFFFFHGKPSMFWITEAGALLTIPVLMWLFRKDTQPTIARERTVVTDLMPTVLLVGTIVALILASFIPNRPDMTNGLICMGMYILALILRALQLWSAHQKTGADFSWSEVVKSVHEIDYETIILLAGLFVVIGGIEEAGVIDALASVIAKAGGSNIFLTYTIIVWGSVLISAFVDNIPYVATMLPVIQGIAATAGIEPYVLYFGLLIGATLGGNLTPVGASANITGMGMLRQEGYEVTNRQFMRIGIPFSLVAVMTGYILTWIIWY